MHFNAKLWTLALILLISLVGNCDAQAGAKRCRNWSGKPRQIPDGSWICSLNVNGTLDFRGIPLKSVRINSVKGSGTVRRKP